MKKPVRVLTYLTCVLISLILCVWIGSEISIQYEMARVGALERSELSEDYGLPILDFIMLFPEATVGILVGIWAARLVTRKQSIGVSQRPRVYSDWAKPDDW